MLSSSGSSPIRPSENISRTPSSEDKKVTRPPPNVRKEFKKILDREDEEQAPPVSSKEEEKTTKKRGLLDIARGEDKDDEDSPPRPIESVKSAKNTGEESKGDTDQSPERKSDLFPINKSGKPVSPGQAENAARESPFSLYKQVSASKQPREPTWAAMAQAASDLSSVVSKESSFTSKKDKLTTKFQEEQADSAYLSPIGRPQQEVAAVKEDSGQQSTRISELKEIVDKIVDKLYTLQTQGKTDTIIVIKQPPIFANSQVVITGYSSANREFNLAFENLRPDAKQLLDANMNSLRTALEESGQVRALHIITTTTNLEHRIPGMQQTFANRDEDRDNQEGKGRQRQKRPDEDLT